MSIRSNIRKGPEPGNKTTHLTPALGPNEAAHIYARDALPNRALDAAERGIAASWPMRRIHRWVPPGRTGAEDPEWFTT